MPIFSWKGIDHHGVNTRGVTSATTESHLKEVLFSQRIALLECRKASSIREDLVGLFQPAVSSEQMDNFLERFALLVSNGVELVTALRTTASVTTNKSFRQTINNLANEVQQGQSLHEALQHYPQLFPPLLIQLVATGESTGKLGLALENIRNHFQQQNVLKQQLQKAALAPLITFGTAVSLMLLIIIFVFPYFESLYQAMGTHIPASTQFVLHLSHAAHSWHGLTWMMIIVIGIYLLSLLFHKTSLKKFIDTCLLHIPLISMIVIYGNTITFMQTISLYLASGLPLTGALEQAQQTVPNTVMKEAIKKIYTAVLEGKSLSEGIKSLHSPFFDDQLIALIHVGELSGTLDIVLKNAQRQWENLFAARVHTITTLFAPLLMIIVGLLIAGMMILLYMPIFNLSALIHP